MFSVIKLNMGIFFSCNESTVSLFLYDVHFCLLSAVTSMYFCQCSIVTIPLFSQNESDGFPEFQKITFGIMA
jgi:hypothetical protein